VAVKAGSNFRIGRGAQEPVFVRSPRPALAIMPGGSLGKRLDFRAIWVHVSASDAIEKIMRITLRWIGIVLILVAVALFIASGQVVDIPGPVQTAKTNYIVTLSLASVTISSVLALGGVVLLGTNFKAKI
jgi:hypothetical protein